jgi:NAD(P)H-dependent nitrite reductase small subunit
MHDLIQDAGVAVRAFGQQVALFLTDKGVFAIDNRDPFSGAAILSRGIIGDLAGQLVVASPMYKQHFSLETGRCLEDETRSVHCWPVQVGSDGVIGLAPPLTHEQPKPENRHETAA